MTPVSTDDRLAELEAKLDGVARQVDYLVGAWRDDARRRQQWDELRHDLAPVTSEALPYLEALLDQVESLSDLGSDISPLGREILVAAMARLADLEQRGYFALGRGVLGCADAVVATLTEDDLRAVGRATPGAIRAIKEMAPGLARALGETPAEAPGLMRLLWRLRRPAARQGLARALGVLEALGGASTGPAAGAPAVH
ncbi:MAG: hypothetical protein H6R33_810 [Actinobacteria bacterium]|nr:hypothetical protein [Actinomycetota bacterium]